MLLYYSYICFFIFILPVLFDSIKDWLYNDMDEHLMEHPEHNIPRELYPVLWAIFSLVWFIVIFVLLETIFNFIFGDKNE